MDSIRTDDTAAWDEADRLFRKAGADALRPRPRLSITEIAGQHRVIPTETSSSPGRYSAALTPYVREIQDRLHPDDPAQVIVYEAAAQAGSKSTIAENWVMAVAGGFYPARMLYALDTDSNAQDWSKDNLDTMIDHSRLLRDRVRNPVSRGKNETILGKWFPGGRLRIIGAHSASAMCRIAAKYVVMDECDRWKENPGYEGNGVSLILARQTTFGPSRKAYICSTPTVENNSEVHEWFLRGDQRYFQVPCPVCGEFQRLEWRDETTKEYRLIWTPGHPDEAHYVCAFCGAEWSETDKNILLPEGRWVASHPECGNGLITSYNLNCLYAPLGWLSWAEVAAEWDAATVLAKTGSIDKLRSFVNIRLAQTFSEPGETIEPSVLADRVEPHWGEKIPAGIKVITCGTDVQDNRLETITIGWGAGWEAWILDYAVILGDPRDRDAWDAHDQVINRQWKTEDHRTIHAAATCVDSGYLPQRVLEYCQPRFRRRVYAIKGDDGRGPIWDRKVRHAAKTKATFFIVHTIPAKDDLAAYLRINQPGPKYVHIPDSVVRDIPDFLNMLTAERRVHRRDRRGQTTIEWKKVSEHRRNEAWDCMVYALAAAHSLVIAGLRIDDAIAVRPQAAPATVAQPDSEAKPADRPVSSGYRFDRNRIEPPPRPARPYYFDRRGRYFNPRIDDDDD